MFHFNKKRQFSLLMAIVLALLLVVYKSANPGRKQNLAEALKKQTYISHRKSSCKKTSIVMNYTVCKTLPVLPIICGDLAEKRDFDQFGKKYKIPNIVYLIMVGNIKFDFLKYLALRSMARIQQPEAIIVYYTTDIPTSEFAQKAIQDIPCLRWVKVEDPKFVNGKQASTRVNLLNKSK
uniref:uncharacterized protein LOC113474262 n=1 Tax=Ciona intestinalis TaxID=7719 RepID=UPI000EF4BC80|nr:uncharacterized protein LOC113474262 [Ciona intestinalis]|eukprot:XP_026690433.1 uncharacterized protein LOC113474262 [Ciona intestinalis]